MTTKGLDDFWKEVQTFVAHEYSLEHTQVVSNSDGGHGYSAERFQETFSQASLPVLHQLESYHVQQAVNRTFGYKKNDWKDNIRKAIREHNLDDFKLILDTYESTLEEEKKPAPKKRGRKSKEEREQWIKEEVAKEANLPLYEKKIEAQLDASLDKLRAEIPRPKMAGQKEFRSEKRLSS